MPQYQVPILPMSEKTTLGESGEFIAGCIDLLEERGTPMQPVMVFAVVAGPLQRAFLAHAIDAMLLVILDAKIRDAVMEALSRVEMREPKPQATPETRKIKFKDNTPVKSIFKQMAAQSMTVLSLTFTEDLNGSFFFLRTPFTISEFLKELPNCVIGDDDEGLN